MSILEWILLFLSVFLLFYALYWEVKDQWKVENMENINQTNDQIETYQFLACFGYEGRVYWRMTYIASFILALVLTYVLAKLYKNEPSFWTFFIILALAFVIFYGTTNYTAFHVNRILCSKARTSVRIL